MFRECQPFPEAVSFKPRQDPLQREHFPGEGIDASRAGSISVLSVATLRCEGTKSMPPRARICFSRISTQLLSPSYLLGRLHFVHLTICATTPGAHQTLHTNRCHPETVWNHLRLRPLPHTAQGASQSPRVGPQQLLGAMGSTARPFLDPPGGLTVCCCKDSQGVSQSRLGT